MTTLEHVELVEAWAWLHAGGGLPEWDLHFGGQRENMEYKFFGYLRFKYPHIPRSLYCQALWAAWMYTGEVSQDLVGDAKKDVAKKFTRKKPTENPLQTMYVTKCLDNVPPMIPPFDDARRLLRAFEGILQDDWSGVVWFKQHGYPLFPADLHDIRPDLSTYHIKKKITEAEEQIHE